MLPLVMSVDYFRVYMVSKIELARSRLPFEYECDAEVVRVTEDVGLAYLNLITGSNYGHTTLHLQLARREGRNENNTRSEETPISAIYTLLSEVLSGLLSRRRPLEYCGVYYNLPLRAPKFCGCWLQFAGNSDLTTT